MVDQFWNSRGLNWGQRLEFLDMLVDACKELSSPVAAHQRAAGDQGMAASVLGTTTTTATTTTTTTTATPWTVPGLRAKRTRYFHPRGRLVDAPHGEVNRLHGSLHVWLRALASGLWTNQMERFRQETGMAPPLTTPSDLVHALRHQQQQEVTPPLTATMAATTTTTTTTTTALQPTTFLLVTKFVSTLCLLLYHGGPFDPHLPVNGRDFCEVVRWYCEFGARQTVSSEEHEHQQEYRQDAHDHDGDASKRSSSNHDHHHHHRPTPTPVMAHPQFRATLLTCLWMVLQLAAANPALLEPGELLPFGLLDAVTDWMMTGATGRHGGGARGGAHGAPASSGGARRLEDLVHWLTTDMYQYESDAWNRKMVGTIVTLMRDRLESQWTIQE